MVTDREKTTMKQKNICLWIEYLNDLNNLINNNEIENICLWIEYLNNDFNNIINNNEI